MLPLNALKTAAVCSLLLSLAGCAGSPARTMIDMQKLNKAAKAKSAENEALILAGSKAGLVFSIDGDSFEGSLPCRQGTLVFENTDTKGTTKVSFLMETSVRTGSPMYTVEPGTYVPTYGSCSYITRKTNSSTTYSPEMFFNISAEGRKPVTLAGGEVVYPGTYKFNQIGDAEFATEFTIPKKDKRWSIKKRRPNLLDRYRNDYEVKEDTP